MLTGPGQGKDCFRGEGPCVSGESVSVRFRCEGACVSGESVRFRGEGACVSEGSVTDRLSCSTNTLCFGNGKGRTLCGGDLGLCNSVNWNFVSGDLCEEEARSESCWSETVLVVLKGPLFWQSWRMVRASSVILRGAFAWNWRECPWSARVFSGSFQFPSMRGNGVSACGGRGGHSPNFTVFFPLGVVAR